MRIRPTRRGAVWLVATAILASPVAIGAGDAAARCAARSVGKDGWTKIAAPSFGDEGFIPRDISAHAVLPSRTDVLFVSNGLSVLRSTDGGCRWSSVLDSDTRVENITLTAGGGGIRELDTSAFSLESERVYVLIGRPSPIGSVIGEGEVALSPRVAVSEDGGATFTEFSRGLPLLGEPVRIRVADGVDSVAYVSVTDPVLDVESLYVTRDAGATWARTTGDSILPNTTGSMTDFAIDPGRPDQVWAWDAETLYRSSNAGATFTVVTEVTSPVSTIEFTPRGIGRLSDVRVYHYDAPNSDVSAPPYTKWTPADAVGIVTSAAPIPYAGVRVLGTSQRVFSHYPNLRTGTTIGPVDVSPVGQDPIDLEGAFDAKARKALVVGRTATSLYQRDPTLPPPPLPPIPPLPAVGDLGECVPGPIGGSSFRPSESEVVLRPGERRRVGYDLSLPPVPSNLDVNFMSDTTGSMGGVIAGLREDIREIVDDICAQRVPVHFGIADFEEFPGVWGTGSPYTRWLPISPVGDELREAIESLDPDGGASDASDSALEAMYQAATGAGRKDPVSGEQLIPRGLSAEWRDDSLKVIVLALDTTWREATPGYPGPAYATVVEALRVRGIKVVGLAIGVRSARGEVVRTNKSDMERLGIATGTLATNGGSDCDGDGKVDVLEGDPLVCVLEDPGRDAVALGPAMTGLLASIEDRAAIGIEVVTDPLVLAPGGLLEHRDIDVKKPSRLGFDTTFVCDEPRYGTSTPVTVNAVSRGRILATTQLVVRCAPPRKPEVPAPVTLIAPVAAAAVPPPPPPPAPVIQVQPQPQPNPNPGPQLNPQVNPAPNLGVVGQEQEQVEVALAKVDISEDAELAMSAVSDEDTTVQVAAGLVAIGLTAGAAYGLAQRSRPQPALVRVTSRR